MKMDNPVEPILLTGTFIVIALLIPENSVYPFAVLAGISVVQILGGFWSFPFLKTRIVFGVPSGDPNQSDVPMRIQNITLSRRPYEQRVFCVVSVCHIPELLVMWLFFVASVFLLLSHER